MRGLMVDLFAGGGGASEGIRRALGRSPHVAINHDPKALEMHARNHRDAWHIPESVWDADPDQVCGRDPVYLLWASPDCKHFSRAKGGKPVDKNIRSLATVVIKWAMMVKPQFIFLENVPEFRDWGPLIKIKVPIPDYRKWCKKHHKNCLLDETHGEYEAFVCEREANPVYEMRPDPERKGATFRWWLACLRDAGYMVDHRILKACDFGAPTTRKRLFVVARRDGQPVVWPEPTHGQGREHPWRTAAECIDWSLPCPSIFERKRPLAEKTLARIARGIVRYVIQAKEPFIVGVGGRAGQSLEAFASDPLGTITAKNDRAVVVPHLVPRYGEREGQAPRCSSVTDPMPTIVQTANGASLVSAFLKRDFGRSVGQPVDAPAPTATQSNHTSLVACSIAKHYGGVTGHEMGRPLGTVTAVDHHSLVAALLTKYHHAKRDEDRCQDPGEPITTLDTQNRFGLITPFIAKICQNGSSGKGSHGADEPLSTIVSKNEHLLCAAHMTKLYGTNTGSDLEAPAPTVTAGGNHMGLVAAFIQKYYSNGSQGQRADDPMHTIVAKARMGLVTVTIGGEDYVITDIGMRMLTPRELARAQGFGDEYILTGSAANQVAKIGNSVPPQFAEALVRANCAGRVNAAAAA